MELARRSCFVIMPFSGTDSCSEEEWTHIFENLIRPAVEGAADLDYECHRSTATRGNIVKGILENLDTAHVVIADLTDQNPNVFYELGVRHTLTDRTIIISQRRVDIPFDLSNYASHEYDWRTREGRQAFVTKIRDLLRDVGDNPQRADNPVSDFLQASRAARAASDAGWQAEMERRIAAVEESAARTVGVQQQTPLGDEIADRSLLNDPPGGVSWAAIAKRMSQ